MSENDERVADVILEFGRLPNWRELGGNRGATSPGLLHKRRTADADAWVEGMVAHGLNLSPNARYVRGTLRYRVTCFLKDGRGKPDQDNAVAALKGLLDLMEPHRPTRGLYGGLRGWLGLVLNDNQLEPMGPIQFIVNREAAPATRVEFFTVDGDTIENDGDDAAAADDDVFDRALATIHAEDAAADDARDDRPQADPEAAGEDLNLIPFPVRGNGPEERPQASFNEEPHTDIDTLSALREWFKLGEEVSALNLKRRELMALVDATYHAESDFEGRELRLLDEVGNPTDIILSPHWIEPVNKPASVSRRKWTAGRRISKIKGHQRLL